MTAWRPTGTTLDAFTTTFAKTGGGGGAAVSTRGGRMMAGWGGVKDNTENAISPEEPFVTRRDWLPARKM